MKPKKEGKRKYLVCRNCDNKKALKTEGYKVGKKREEEQSSDIVVMNEEQKDESLPVTEKNCPECGHGKAAWWSQQTRSGDEAPTRFFKCKKCGNKWREYD